MDTKFGEDARQKVSMDKTRKTSKRPPRRSFTPEFKAEAVRLRRIGDRSVAQVAKDLDLTETAPCEWVQRAMSTVQDGDLSVSALASAMRARGSPRGVLVHSDGCGIYGDEEYLKKLEEHGVKRSMSRKKNPWDDAVIESFFSTLRFELLGRTRFADPDEAERGISEWIERFYNLHRRYTTLGSVSPINYESAWQMRKQRT
jgi:transposase InsO family protein